MAYQVALQAMDGFKFGADPECVIRDEKGRAVPAEGLIPGTKDNPHPVKCGAIQVDGFAAEFNIDPASNFEDFNRNISTVLKELQAALPKGYTLDFPSAIEYLPEVFDAAPDKAKELGCHPDFNAWTKEVNPPPRDPENPRLRCFAGHIHLGWTEGAENSDSQHIMNCVDITRQLDWFLGGWSLKMDDDPRRRRLYGRAGAFRPKPYGVEYRVLSNFWITTRERRLAVWNRLQTAITEMRRFMPDRVPENDNLLLVEAINETKRNALLEAKYRFPLQIMGNARMFG